MDRSKESTSFTTGLDRWQRDRRTHQLGNARALDLIEGLQDVDALPEDKIGQQEIVFTGQSGGGSCRHVRGRPSGGESGRWYRQTPSPSLSTALAARATQHVIPRSAVLAGGHAHRSGELEGWASLFAGRPPPGQRGRIPACPRAMLSSSVADGAGWLLTYPARSRRCTYSAQTPRGAGETPSPHPVESQPTDRVQ